MASYGEALGSAVREGFCTLTNLNNQMNAFLGANAPGLVGDFFASMNTLGEQFHRGLCGREPPPRDPSQFIPGGQCPGTRYLIDVAFRYRDEDDENAPWQNYSITAGQTGLSIYGPIENVRFIDGQNGDSVGWRADVRTASGALRENASIGLSADGNIAEPIQFNIRRFDGQEDACGNSPTNQNVNITNNRHDTDITYTTNDGNDITIPIGIVYAPVNVNANGEFNIPITVEVNGELNAEITGNFNLSTGGISFDAPGLPGGGNGGCNNTPDGVQDAPIPDTDDDPDTTIEIPDPQDPATFKKILRAVVVTSQTVPQNITTVFQGEGPTLYIPRLGNVYFVVRIGGKNVWLGAIPVRHKSELIPCPWEKGAVDVRFHSIDGVEATLTPVYDRVQVDTGQSAAPSV